MIQDSDWIDPVRLEARVAGVVDRNRARLADPVQASAAFRRLTEELARSLGAAGIADGRAVALGLLRAANGVQAAGADVATTHRGYRFRVYSMPEQEALFWQFAGVCRLVYKTCA
jgi:Helix-turn-helix domain